MHAYKGPKGTRFNYNSDFSGDIYIHNAEGVQIAVVPAEDILALVAYQYVMMEAISQLEGMNWEQILRRAGL